LGRVPLLEKGRDMTSPASLAHGSRDQI